MVEASATALINRPAAEVFAAVSDIARMGEWSPECTGGRWVAPATGPAVGAKFEGDNIAHVGPITLKRWTTTSEVTECVPDKVFEFIAEGYTTWRYELTEADGATTLTESYAYDPQTGVRGFLYDVVARRPAAMAKGIQRTVDRIKAVLES
ncbi:MAG: SRPBCC family protein [Acidimicrobiales bacterium]